MGKGVEGNKQKQQPRREAKGPTPTKFGRKITAVHEKLEELKKTSLGKGKKKRDDTTEVKGFFWVQDG